MSYLRWLGVYDVLWKLGGKGDRVGRSSGGSGKRERGLGGLCSLLFVVVS